MVGDREAYWIQAGVVGVSWHRDPNLFPTSLLLTLIGQSQEKISIKVQ